MNFAAIEPALSSLASAITGITSACCVFDSAPRPMTPDGRYVILSWISRSGVGLDGSRWVYAAAVDALDEMTPTVEGSRELVLQFAVEVIADQRAGSNATAILEQARTRLSRPSSLAALEAVGLALATIGVSTTADYPADGRMVSRSLFEVRLNAHASEADTAGRTSYIATVQGSSTLGGIAVPEPIEPLG